MSSISFPDRYKHFKDVSTCVHRVHCTKVLLIMLALCLMPFIMLKITYVGLTDSIAMTEKLKCSIQMHLVAT